MRGGPTRIIYRAGASPPSPALSEAQLCGARAKKLRWLRLPPLLVLLSAESKNFPLRGKNEGGVTSLGEGPFLRPPL